MKKRRRKFTNPIVHSEIQKKIEADKENSIEAFT